jgi:hypothetical protein
MQACTSTRREFILLSDVQFSALVNLLHDKITLSSWNGSSLLARSISRTHPPLPLVTRRDELGAKGWRDRRLGRAPIYGRVTDRRQQTAAGRISAGLADGGAPRRGEIRRPADGHTWQFSAAMRRGGSISGPSGCTPPIPLDGPVAMIRPRTATAAGRPHPLQSATGYRELRDRDLLVR